MWATYIRILKPGVIDHLGDYYGRPYDVFESYYEMNLPRISGDWQEMIGSNRQMDWGSWLYVCDRETLHELTDGRIDSVVPIIPAEKNDGVSARREAPIALADLTDQDQYGILEVELW